MSTVDQVACFGCCRNLGSDSRYGKEVYIINAQRYSRGAPSTHGSSWADIKGLSGLRMQRDVSSRHGKAMTCWRHGLL